MVARQTGARRDHQARSRRPAGDLDGRRRQRRQHRQLRPHLHHPARQAGAHRRRPAGDRPAAPHDLARCPASTCSSSRSSRSHRHHAVARPVPVRHAHQQTSPSCANGRRRMEERMRRIPTITDVNSDQQIRARSTVIDIDRDTASRLGLTVDQIRNTLYSAYGTRQVSTIYASDDTYPVILEADPKYADTNEVLRRMQIRTPSGTLVPLDTVAKRSDKPSALSVNHIGQLAGGDHFLQPGAGRRARRGGARHPDRGGARSACRPSISTSFEGSAQVFQQAVGQPGPAAVRRRAGGLHRPRHPLRKLHPSADDPVGPAVGRHRRAGHR